MFLKLCAMAIVECVVVCRMYLVVILSYQYYFRSAHYFKAFFDACVHPICEFLKHVFFVVVMCRIVEPFLHVLWPAYSSLLISVFVCVVSFGLRSLYYNWFMS